MSDSFRCMDFSMLGSSLHWISQAQILEWVAISSSRGSSKLRNQSASPVFPELQVDSLPAESFGKKPANNNFSRIANTPGLKFKNNEISFYIPFQKPREFWFQNVLIAQNENQSYDIFF